MEGLCGTAVPNGSGLSAGRTGSPAQVVVGAYGGPAGDVSSQRRRPTSREDGESCQGGGWCLWRARRGWHFPTARAHQLGGRGVLPRQRSVPMEGLRGRALPNGPGSPARGTGVLPRWRSVPMEGLRGTAIPNGPGPPSGGMGSLAVGGWCLWSECRGRQFPTAWAHCLGGRGVLPMRHSVPMEGPRGTAVPKGPGALTGGGHGLLPRWWSVPMKRLWPMVAPIRRRPISWGDGKSCLGGGRCLWRACGGQ